MAKKPRGPKNSFTGKGWTPPKQAAIAPKNSFTGKGWTPPKQAAIAPPAGWAPPPAPAAPPMVNPFWNAADLQAINDFNTSLELQTADLDRSLRDLETDTDFAKKDVDKGAKGSTAAATDDAAARGIFQSSIKDAVIYDIEATRSLQQKFLDDKLTTARLDAGARKGSLGRSKENFDKAMNDRKVENAQGVNDPNSEGWAAAMAAWQSAQPAVAPAPNVTFSKPAPPKAAPTAAAVSNQSAYTAAQTRAKQASSAAMAKAKKKPKNR